MKKISTKETIKVTMLDGTTKEYNGYCHSVEQGILKIYFWDDVTHGPQVAYALNNILSIEQIIA